jgi:hypothetical protein
VKSEKDSVATKSLEIEAVSKVPLRHCERSEAIQFINNDLWIASLAMTKWNF